MTMPRLVALDLPGGPAFVEVLQRVWERGDAAFPLDQRLPPPAREAALAAAAPDLLIDEHGDEHRVEHGRPVEPGDALVVMTSGSSGAARGVVLTHDAVAASSRATSERLAVTAADHWLACLPLSHVGGLSVVTRALHTGTALTVLSGPDLAAIDEALARGVTLVSLVPTLLARVDPSRFRAVLLGGSKPPSPRPANVVATYGLTETGSGVVYEGVPLTGVEVRTDERGVIELRCPMLLRCYRDGTDPKDPEGWFTTGDAGTWDGTRLQVHGRVGDLVITGGENVWPEAVEVALALHPEVAEVAVAGRPDPDWGQAVVAWVVARDPANPPSLAELREHVKATLPAHCAPRRLELVPALPRTGSGKVIRAALGSAG